MLHINRWIIVVLLVIVGLHLSACNTAAPLEASSEQPAVVEPIEGTEINRLTLTEKAAQRLDLQMAPVREEQMNGATRLVVPYSAVIYDLNGNTWMYISPAPLTYVREPISVDFIEGDMVVLVEGPAAGTEVVTVGVPELYGADTGIGK